MNEDDINNQHCPNYKLYGFCKLYSKCKFSLFHKPCKSFLLSSCSKGETCPFFHDLTEKSNFSSLNEQKRINLTPSKCCKSFKEKGVCLLDKKCPNFYFHQECRFFSKGRCNKEEKCPFYHKEEKKENFNNFDSSKKGLSNETGNCIKGDNYDPKSQNSNLKRFGVCCICYVEKADHVALPCGHMGYCFKCGENLEKCGICRKKIEMIQKIYFI